MKMVKSLLLGSAAGVVAMAGAQAADLPVKAKPVQYVKICSLYGAGFYYIPGTDMCLKMGGWVRAEYGWGSNGNLAWGPFAGNANNRGTNNSVLRARGYITADARNQSEYGTIRAYIAVGVSDSNVGLNTAANTFSANRAFVQFAGFTFGVSQSFFDFYSVPATALWGAYPASDTGDPGWMVMGYTAQFGGGLSASLAAEERRMTQIINVNGAGAATQAFTVGGVAPVPTVVGISTIGIGSGNVAAGGFPTLVPGITANAGAYGGFQSPDVVGNLRVDQKWGSAQLMAAYHEVNATYYGTTQATGGPSTAAGWVVGGGVKILTPMIGAGDYLQAQINYTEGAVRYVFMTPNGNWGKIDGINQAYGVLSDAVYGSASASASSGATGLDLTTAWGVNAAYEHFWNKSWKTSAYGGYAAVSYNSEANANLCTLQGAGNSNGVKGTGAVATAGCDNNWSTWWLGSRTQWNVSPDTYLAVDILYSKLLSASTFNGLIGSNTVADVDNWAARFRVHKDFYP